MSMIDSGPSNIINDFLTLSDLANYTCVNRNKKKSVENYYTKNKLGQMRKEILQTSGYVPAILNAMKNITDRKKHLSDWRTRYVLTISSPTLVGLAISVFYPSTKMIPLLLGGIASASLIELTSNVGLLHSGNCDYSPWQQSYQIKNQIGWLAEYVKKSRNLRSKLDNMQAETP